MMMMMTTATATTTKTKTTIKKTTTHIKYLTNGQSLNSTPLYYGYLSFQTKSSTDR
jgi:hypothetical protein